MTQHGHQFLVRAAFQDVPLIQGQDTITVLRCGKVIHAV